jgi:hypothetical protein
MLKEVPLLVVVPSAFVTGSVIFTNFTDSFRIFTRLFNVFVGSDEFGGE